MADNGILSRIGLKPA